MTHGKGRAVWAAGTALSLFMATSGCAFRKDGDDIERFREAIPEADAVAMPGPETSAEASSRAASAGPTERAQTTGSGAPNGPWAKYYGVTRELRDGVRSVTGVVLGAVWIIVHTEPSSVGNDEAIWGP